MPASTESTIRVNKALFCSLGLQLVRFFHRQKVWRHRQEVLDGRRNPLEAEKKTGIANAGCSCFRDRSKIRFPTINE